MAAAADLAMQEAISNHAMIFAMLNQHGQVKNCSMGDIFIKHRNWNYLTHLPWEIWMKF